MVRTKSKIKKIDKNEKERNVEKWIETKKCSNQKKQSKKEKKTVGER